MIKNSRDLGCTIVTLAINDKIFFCNNEDYKRPKDGTFISFTPPQEIPEKWNLPDSDGINEIYGFSLVGSKFDNGLYPQGGINSEGLSYDMNALPPIKLKEQKGEKWSDATNFYDLLWRNKTVEDVINWFKTKKFPYPEFSIQMHVADATGDAVVICANKNGEFEFVKMSKEKYLISTNFNLINPDNHYTYPCKRFDKAKEISKKLAQRNDVTIDDCIEIIEATHVEYKGEAGTLYSNIFDLKKKKIHLFHIGNFERKVEFDLEEELHVTNKPSEADLYKIAGTGNEINFENMRIYTISKLFE